MDQPNKSDGGPNLLCSLLASVVIATTTEATAPDARMRRMQTSNAVIQHGTLFRANYVVER